MTDGSEAQTPENLPERAADHDAETIPSENLRLVESIGERFLEDLRAGNLHPGFLPGL